MEKDLDLYQNYISPPTGGNLLIDRLFFRLAVKERFQKNFLKKDICSGTSSNYFTLIRVHVNPFSANPSKWSNTLKQFIGFCRRIV